MIDRVELFSDLIEFSGKSIHRTDHGVDAFERAVIAEPFFFVSVENASDTLFQILLYEHSLQNIGDNIIDLFAPCLHRILSLLGRFEESISEFRGKVGGGIADDVFQHLVDDGCHLLGDLLNLSLPLLDLAVIGLFLALLLIDLFLNEYLLLCKVFELLAAFVVSLPSEGFIGGIGYLCIRIGNLLDGFLIYLAIVAHPGDHPCP